MTKEFLDRKGHRYTFIEVFTSSGDLLVANRKIKMAKLYHHSIDDFLIMPVQEYLRMLETFELIPIPPLPEF